jgi:hypothetical protein
VTARITDSFKVEELPGKSREGRQVVKLLEPLEYRVGSDDSSEVIIVPKGFETDFASIPVGLRNLFPPMGRWSRAAILHDWLYATGGLSGRYTRKQADKIFREAMLVLGVPKWRAEVMFQAVRLGGSSGWLRD